MAASGNRPARGNDRDRILVRLGLHSALRDAQRPLSREDWFTAADVTDRDLADEAVQQLVDIHLVVPQGDGTYVFGGPGAARPGDGDDDGIF